MKEYSNRETRTSTIKDWFDYWHPCICGHLSHEHEMSNNILPFSVSMFNCFRGGKAWIEECDQCNCPVFKHGSMNDEDLIAKVKHTHRHLWGYVP